MSAGTASAASIPERLQSLELLEQVLALARLAEGRSDTRRFSPSDLDLLFDALGLPRPAKVSNLLLTAEKQGLVARPKNTRGQWRLTPLGSKRAASVISDMDLPALAADATNVAAPRLGNATQAELPPGLAPPELIGPLRRFVGEFAFEANVFGMTRFPRSGSAAPPDPVKPALEAARAACAAHGMTFHLASDRAIVDDLWGNVLTHMWGCKYGLAFFEDKVGVGLNYNLTIEVGSMLTLGRRVALLKDGSVNMPTDLVGKIYKSIDLANPSTAEAAIHLWLNVDLGLGRCSSC